MIGHGPVYRPWPGVQAMRKESGIIGDMAFQIASKKGDTVKRDWTGVVKH